MFGQVSRAWQCANLSKRKKRGTREVEESSDVDLFWFSIHGINDSVCIRLTLGLPHGLAKLQMGGWPKTLYSPSFCLTDQEWTKNGDGYRLVRAPEIVSGCSPPRLQIVVYGGCVLGPRTCALSPSQLIGSSDTQIRCRGRGRCCVYVPTMCSSLSALSLSLPSLSMFQFQVHPSESYCRVCDFYFCCENLSHSTVSTSTSEMEENINGRAWNKRQIISWKQNSRTSFSRKNLLSECVHVKKHINTRVHIHKHAQIHK